MLGIRNGRQPQLDNAIVKPTALGPVANTDTKLELPSEGVEIK